MLGYRDHIEMLPPYMHKAVITWIEDGKRPGDFLYQFLIGRLYGVLRHADPVNLEALGDYMMFFYNYAPAGCFGSPEKVTAWSKQGGLTEPEVRTKPEPIAKPAIRELETDDWGRFLDWWPEAEEIGNHVITIEEMRIVGSTSIARTSFIYRRPQGDEMTG